MSLHRPGGFSPFLFVVRLSSLRTGIQHIGEIFVGGYAPDER